MVTFSTTRPLPFVLWRGQQKLFDVSDSLLSGEADL